MRSYLLGTPAGMDRQDLAGLLAWRAKLHADFEYVAKRGRLARAEQQAEKREDRARKELDWVATSIGRNLNYVRGGRRFDVPASVYPSNPEKRWWTQRLERRVERMAGMSYKDFAAVDVHRDGRYFQYRHTFETAITIVAKIEIMKSKAWKRAYAALKRAEESREAASKEYFDFMNTERCLDYYIRELSDEEQSKTNTRVRRTGQYKHASSVLGDLLRTNRQLRW